MKTVIICVGDSAIRLFSKTELKVINIKATKEEVKQISSKSWDLLC